MLSNYKIIVALVTILSILPYLNAEPCVNSCNMKGRCTYPGRQCECFDGFQGADCSEFTCPFGPAWTDLASGVDDAHNNAECSNMGTCDRSLGTCVCRVGFEGKACERKSCPNQCNAVGKCQSMFYYALTKDPGSGVVHKYENIWDAEMIYGCNCDDGYYGPDCALRYCPTGDDPLTGNSASTSTNPIQYNELQKVTCKAGSGTFTITFRGKTTIPISYNAKSSTIQAAIEALTTIGAGNIKIVMYGNQACLDSGASWTVEFLQNFGSLPLMVADASKLRFLSSISAPSIAVAKATIGTKENEECSNRGLCLPGSGYCECSTYYDTSNGYNLIGTRGDCGFATQTIQFCPGVISCSGHGECSGNPKYRCTCSAGWQGADCSERTCPKAVSWFTRPSAENEAHLSEFVECSDMGECDRSIGGCLCTDGFVGSSCQYLNCPGDAELCGAHGQCLDMNSLATHAKVNGVIAGFTYGETPNKPSTWDAFKMFGCLCDDGYEGYDCSLRICPFGDDPGTEDQRDERQIITCVDADDIGTISIKYKEQSSISLSPLSTAADIKAALEGLTTLGRVNVETYTQGDTDALCSVAGSQMVVTFLTEHGDLPDLQINAQTIDSIIVVEDVKGTKEWIQCSGKGLCDTSIGECVCFTGYSSSDGHGEAGILRDCGYIDPISIES